MRSRSLVEWTPQRALARLLERLNRSDLSARQARQYLLDKGCPEELAEAALQTCQQRRFLDDARLAELLVEKGQRVGWSQRRLHQEQSQRGIPAEGGLDELASCRLLAERWLRRGIEPEKVAARLQRRGFAYGVVRQSLELELKEGDDDCS